MSFMTTLSAISYLKEGKLKPLAVTSKYRLARLPNVPTIAEAGMPGVELDSWNGLFAPVETPKETIDKLYAEIANVLAKPEVRKAFKDQAATVTGSSPTEFSDSIRREVEQSATIVKIIKLKLE